MFRDTKLKTNHKKIDIFLEGDWTKFSANFISVWICEGLTDRI